RPGHLAPPPAAAGRERGRACRAAPWRATRDRCISPGAVDGPPPPKPPPIRRLRTPMRQTRQQHLARMPSRRGVLRMGAIAGVTILSRGTALARHCRSLSLYAVHTGERLTADYCVDGSYQPDALRAIARVMRD